MTPGSYYRMPQLPTADGSFTNEVVHAYFTLGKPGWGTPPSCTEFNPHTDEQVVFVFHVSKTTEPSTLTGVVHRPDGTVHSTFTRTAPERAVGTYAVYATHHGLDMASLRDWQGWWTVAVSRGDDLLGRYRFLLADVATVGRFRSR